MIARHGYALTIWLDGSFKGPHAMDCEMHVSDPGVHGEMPGAVLAVSAQKRSIPCAGSEHSDSYSDRSFMEMAYPGDQ